MSGPAPAYFHFRNGPYWGHVAGAAALTAQLRQMGWTFVPRHPGEGVARCNGDGTIEWWLREPDQNGHAPRAGNDPQPG